MASCGYVQLFCHLNTGSTPFRITWAGHGGTRAREKAKEKTRPGYAVSCEVTRNEANVPDVHRTDDRISGKRFKRRPETRTQLHVFAKITLAPGRHQVHDRFLRRAGFRLRHRSRSSRRRASV